MQRQLANGDIVGGRYRVLDRLGSGGMAAVYQARDVELDLDVALKVLPSQLAADPSFVARFRREAQMLARLTHPHIVRFFTSGEEADLYYLVLELQTGGTLSDRLDGKPWALADVLDVLRPIAEAIDYAHGKHPPVIHRDLKPANILFDEQGLPVVSDFGLARLVEPVQDPDSGPHLSLTRNQVLGTPAYMAPEQAEGQRAGPAVDIYALGTIAYELLTGELPFSADNTVGLLVQVATRDVPSPRQKNPALSRVVERAILRSLAKDPRNRFASAGAFIDELASGAPRQKPFVWEVPARKVLLDATRTLAAPTTVRPRKGSGGWRLVAMLGAAVVAAGGIAFRLTSVSGSVAGQSTAPQALAIDDVNQRVLPTIAPVTKTAVEPTSTPDVPATTTALPPTASPTVAPSPTPGQTQAWRAVLDQLDGLWGRDWPAAIGLVSEHLARFPDDSAARDKLYAARIAYAGSLEDQGQAEEAARQLELASQLMPGRGEAEDGLLALTPVPTAAPTSIAGPPVQNARPVPTVARLAPASGAGVQAQPTPTKVSVGSGIRPPATPTKSGIPGH